jgi:hypothetical protein
MTQRMDNLVTFGGMVLLGIALVLGLPQIHQSRSADSENQWVEIYSKGYQDGIYEGIKRAQAEEKSELPLPVSDEPGCDITPEKPKVNYLERLKTK